MPAHEAWRVAVRWDVFNSLFDYLARRGVPTLRLRYEDYVDDLDATLARCAAFGGLPFTGRPQQVASSHGIAGNPARFAPSEQPITRDDRWVNAMGAYEHLLVSGLTWPVRRRYGYRFGRDRPVGELGVGS
jgi:hypothetical protein